MPITSPHPVITELAYCGETVHHDFHNEQHSPAIRYRSAGKSAVATGRFATT